MDKKWPHSLCANCRYLREVGSKRGSTFWMCQKHKENPLYVKYPPQPVYTCYAFEENKPLK